METSLKIPVGISQCLLGEPVRYDGGHKLSRACTDLLGEHFEYVPFCPEVAIGMGVPRPPIRLVAGESGLRARGVDEPGLDVTAALSDYAERVAPRVARLSGFILMQKSPSCGLFSTPRYQGEGAEPLGYGPGLFAAGLRRRFPDLPMAEAGELEDAGGRARFLARVRAYHARQR